ncbi:MAG: glycosyltransferase family 2 protein [Balneolaceae bacterium]
MIETDHNKESRAASARLEVSVVVPLFEESQSLPELIEGIGLVLQHHAFEVILVDDGSRDDSWQVIRELRTRYPWLRGVSLQTNYGKSTALQTGFDSVRGRYVVTLDADLQDDPNEIPALLEELKSGYDLVCGWKKKRKDPLTKIIPSRFFNMVTRWVTGIKLHDFNCGLKVYRKEVIDRINLYGELHRYVPLLAKWQGYDRIGEKVVRHHPRKYGRTKFGISRFIHGFLDLVTLVFVNNYMSRPMHFFGSFGILTLAAGGIINLYLAYVKIIHNEALANRPLLFLGVMLVVIGVQFFSIGFLGDMINKSQTGSRQPNIRDRI